ncbi:MAG: lipo-like protein [Anaerolineae bacterium]|nr:lipo-like protein [Anaerolineae bacterium]
MVKGRNYRTRGFFAASLGLVAVLALGLLLGACGSKEDESSVTGTVIYRERIALPDDAVVTVQLQDVSKQDVKAAVMGEQLIKTEGKQVPIDYAVPYDEDAIDERFTYSVSARIEDGAGKLLFISDTVIPVITRDNPSKDVEILVVSVASP